jgi:hypothetical protein
MLQQVVLNVYRRALIKEEYPVFVILCHPVACLLSCLYLCIVFLLSSQFYTILFTSSSYSTTTSSNTRSISIQRVLGYVSRGGKTAEA